MAEFLLELLSEEIPARMQVRARDDLQTLVCKALDDAEIAYGEVQSFVTPRRLVLAIDGLAGQQPDVDIERKGPRVGAPDKALEGFKRSLGVERYELAEQDDRKGAFYVARFCRVGRATADVLSDIVPEILRSFPWPKSMRWSDHSVRWIRPLRGILCLLDGAIVPFAFGPVSSGKVSRGHRFHAPEPFEVRTVEQYQKELSRRFVVLDRDQRLAGIRGQAEMIAHNEGLRLRRDDALLEEITGLVEWPVAVSGAIDQEFMALPSEVLVTSMRAHQKYLALEDESGNLAPRFIAIANLEAEDGGEAIVAGNQRVLRARLWDAKFFWDQDRRLPLEARSGALDQMLFHSELGTIGDKAEMIRQLGEWFAARLPGVDATMVRQASKLAKADLVTGMVGEFPELQGVMGCYYAKQQGVADEVAIAIRDHYLPQGPTDRCPTSPTSVVVALADKLDTLAGLFLIGERPTGSKDPFGLRRAALGVIRIILENKLRLPLGELIEDAIRSRANVLSNQIDRVAVADELKTFFADRLKVHLRDAGVRHDLISAVFATGDDDLVRLLARVDALDKFLATDDGANLLIAYRRATNILRIEERKDNKVYREKPDYDKLGVEELDLNFALMAAENNTKPLMANYRFKATMEELAKLRSPIDSFFEKVTVNAPNSEVREHRLRLLNRVRAAIDEIADFSLIEDVVSENHNRRVA